MKKEVRGTITIGDFEYKLVGEIDKDKDLIQVRVESKIDDKTRSKEAWELLELLCSFIEDIASKEVEERYVVQYGD